MPDEDAPPSRADLEARLNSIEAMILELTRRNMVRFTGHYSEDYDRMVADANEIRAQLGLPPHPRKIAQPQRKTPIWAWPALAGAIALALWVVWMAGLP